MEEKETKYECFSCYCGCNPCPECQEKELIHLRAWKAKARPLLLSLNSRLVQDMEMFPDCIPESFNEQKATLTELLGGE